MISLRQYLTLACLVWAACPAPVHAQAVSAVDDTSSAWVESRTNDAPRDPDEPVRAEVRQVECAPSAPGASADDGPPAAKRETLVVDPASFAGSALRPEKDEGRIAEALRHLRSNAADAHGARA